MSVVSVKLDSLSPAVWVAEKSTHETSVELLLQRPTGVEVNPAMPDARNIWADDSPRFEFSDVNGRLVIKADPVLDPFAERTRRPEK